MLYDRFGDRVVFVCRLAGEDHSDDVVVMSVATREKFIVYAYALTADDGADEIADALKRTRFVDLDPSEYKDE